MQRYHVNRTRSAQYAQIVGLLILAVALRFLLYDHIAIRGDLGYWMLDGKWVADGDRPYFDFIGRSPLFLYLYAGAIELFGESIAVYRWFVASLWFLAALVFTGMTRLVTSHRASLITLAAATLTPFPLAFGFYSSSQSLAVLLSALALAVLVARRVWWGYGVAGALVGLAFLSRRALVLAGPAIATWLVLEWRRGRMGLSALVFRGAFMGLTFLASITTGYLLLAWPDVGATADLFIIHFVNLFVSSGSGGVPLLSMAGEVASGDTASSVGGAPLQSLFDNRTQQAIMATTLGGAVLLVALVDYARTASTEWLRSLDRTMWYTMGAVLAALAAVTAALSGFWYRVLWVAAIVALVWALHARDRLPTARLLAPEVALPTLMFAWVQLGYFVRPNLYATYYGMDSLLFLSVPLGIMADRWVRSLSRHRIAVATVAVTVLVVAGGIPMAPLLPGLSTTADGQHDRVPWYTPDKVKRLNADLEERAGAGATVLTNQPNYVAVNDVRLFEQNSRAVYLRHLFGDTGPQRRYYGRLIDAMRSGEISYVVHDRFNKVMLETNSTANATLYDCYEAVDADGLYQSMNTTLYRYDGCE